MINACEIVESLTICARTSPCPGYCPHYAIGEDGEECARLLMEKAADLIESLQADLAVYKKYGEPHEWRDAKADAAKIAKLLEDNKTLMIELATSQRREQSAVKDLRETAIFGNSCSFCIHKRNLDICPNGDKEKCWQWRGSQE